VSDLEITLAIGPYDHVRDLVSGRVRADGLSIRWLDLPVEEIFHRFIRYREWDVSEMSLGKYVSLLSQGDESLVALPVFPSRVFRQSSIYVRRGSGLSGPADLRGKRVGLPEWAQTAAIYTRGFLMHEIGLALQDVRWIQGGVNEAGRKEKVQLRLPEGVHYASVADRSLTELLLASELDAILSARPPWPVSEGRPDVVRLIPGHREAEKAYFLKTRVFPIMHVVAMRRDLFTRAPWAAMNLCNAFEEAKRRSLSRALDVTASYFPVPWLRDHALECQAIFGPDLFPYGIEPNRATLEAFLSFAHEQGVLHRRLSVEDLFPAQVQTRVRV